MDNSQAPASILDTLRTVEFRLGLKGYNVDEVDEYLDKAAQEAEALQEHVRQLNERLRQASERIAQLERDKRAAARGCRRGGEEAAAAAAASAESAALSDETLQRTLLLAQKFVDQTKRESEAEAAAVIAQAEETARAAIAAAEATAAQLQAETHQELREEVTRLEATRTELATDVESMARHLESERNRLHGALSEILKWVDENVQPANSLMGIKPKAAAGAQRVGRAARWTAAAGRPAEADDGAPTLNLQSASAPAGAPGTTLIPPHRRQGAVLPLPGPSAIVTRSPARSSSGRRPPLRGPKEGSMTPASKGAQVKRASASRSASAVLPGRRKATKAGTKPGTKRPRPRFAQQLQSVPL